MTKENESQTRQSQQQCRTRLFCGILQFKEWRRIITATVATLCQSVMTLAADIQILQEWFLKRSTKRVQIIFSPLHFLGGGILSADVNGTAQPLL